MNDPFRFLFAVCQVGAEAALKTEISRRWPDFNLAFSRPGFATFKLPDNHKLAIDFDLGSTFARTYGFSLGNVHGKDGTQLADQLWEIVGEREIHHLHVWQRDSALPGEKGFVPGITPLANEIGDVVASRDPAGRSLKVNRTARSGQVVLD